MRPNRQSRRCKAQRGSALLIAIFALLLISVVGIALLVSTGTDSALAGNYRTSTSAYYAAVAGLEEARGRLLRKNLDFINKSGAYPSLFGGQGTPSFGLTDVLYIVNPASGESVDPTDSSSPYADKEYGSEFTWQLGGANVYSPVASTSPMAGIPGPLYKWVRINAVTEAAIQLDVNPGGGPPSYDSTTPLYYDGNGLNLTSSGAEALEITAFAMMPDKSTKLLQYVVAPTSLNLTFPSALTIAGNGISYAGPDSTGFYVNGSDPTSGRTCSNPPLSPFPAIGYTNSADQSTLSSAPGISNHPGNYTGYSPPTPSLGLVTLPATLQKPGQLEALVQTIAQGADVVIAGPANRYDMPTSMSPSNSMTVVVNGDLDLLNWRTTGYGLLVVTGNLNYDPDASWVGIVLVIGKGTVTGSRMGNGRFNGAMLVAQTRDGSGAVLPDPNLGASSVSFVTNMGGAGIYYDSCAILQAQMPTKYRVLSFREITQ
jgi:hypothetical protein